MKSFFTLLITALLAGTATWIFLRKLSPDASRSAAAAGGQPLYYQSAMHPWIKSDQPGRCTICGMELTPVYPGEKGFDAAADSDTLVLTQSQIQVLQVQTAEAKIQPLVRTLVVSGIMDDDATRHRILSAYVDGRLEKLHVNYVGAEVEVGQPLAEIYSPNLLQAEREYRQLSGELRTNTGLRLRQMGLTAEQLAAVADKPEDALTSQILSPIGGTVVGQKVYEGQYVSTGETLFEIADFSTMWFMFRAYEQDLEWIQIGQPVMVTTAALPAKSFAGKVTFVDPNFDEVTRSTQVRVELPNPKVEGRRELLHRFYAEGAVSLAAPEVLAVPRSAVIQTGAEAVVYVSQEGGAYVRTPVQIGRRGDALIEILSGLTAGEQVVTNGNLLMDGQAEMNRGMAAPVAPAAVGGHELTVEQTKVAAEFASLLDSMAAALAADDLAGFNRASEPAMATTERFTELLAGLPVAEEPRRDLTRSRHFHGFADLRSARLAFHPFAMASAAIIERLRKLEGFPEVQIWECPMVDEALPEVPKKGRWLQRGSRKGANPYFGAEMLECGKEIKP
jgi:Cu(I)/Ag(I) efflux system membrane fusion protein